MVILTRFAMLKAVQNQLDPAKVGTAIIHPSTNPPVTNTMNSSIEPRADISSIRCVSR